MVRTKPTIQLLTIIVTFMTTKNSLSCKLLYVRIYRFLRASIWVCFFAVNLRYTWYLSPALLAFLLFSLSF